MQNHPAALFAEQKLRRLISLVDELLALPHEVEWVEFKRNNHELE